MIFSKQYSEEFIQCLSKFNKQTYKIWVWLFKSKVVLFLKLVFPFQKLLFLRKPLSIIHYLIVRWHSVRNMNVIYYTAIIYIFIVKNQKVFPNISFTTLVLTICRNKFYVIQSVTYSLYMYKYPCNSFIIKKKTNFPLITLPSINKYPSTYVNLTLFSFL